MTTHVKGVQGSISQSNRSILRQIVSITIVICIKTSHCTKHLRLNLQTQSILALCEIDPRCNRSSQVRRNEKRGGGQKPHRKRNGWTFKKKGKGGRENGLVECIHILQKKLMARHFDPSRVFLKGWMTSQRHESVYKFNMIKIYDGKIHRGQRILILVYKTT